MTDRRLLLTPGGVPVRVSAARVEEKLAAGWREQAPAKKPSRRKPKSDDAEQQD